MSNNPLSEYTLEIDPVFENDFHPDVVDEFIRITCDPTVFDKDDPNVKLGASYFASYIDESVIWELREKDRQITLRKKLYGKPTRKGRKKKLCL